MPEITVRALAELCGGTARGGLALVIRGAASLEDAGTDELSFVSNAKARAAAATSNAGCLLVDAEYAAQLDRTHIEVKNPRYAFARALHALYPQPKPAPGIHPAAVIATTATIGDGVYVGPYTVIGEHVRIGANCFIDASVRIGDGTSIGDGCTLHSFAILYPRVAIGNNVILHSGCVLGADGFGFAMMGDHYEKFPQVGTVVVEDDVEIGANSCIDRAALGITRIGQGTKLDNMVHIAHNCTIGRHVVIAAQTGLAGGCTVGDYAVVGGQVGMGEKVFVEPKAIIGSGAGILSFAKVHAGEPVWGTPARPLRQYLKGLANVNKIAELRTNLREVTRRIEELEKGK